MPRRAKNPKPPPRLELSRDRELERILSLNESAAFTSLSVQALKAHYGHLIIQLTPRRHGIKLKHLIEIGK